jgi:hypothetical protein
MQVESEFIAGAANTVGKGAVWLEMEDDQSVLLYGIANVIGVADVNSQVRKEVISGGFTSALFSLFCLSLLYCIIN